MPADPLIGQLILQLLLIFVNAFFAMTEIAVIAVNDNKLARMAEEGNKKAITLMSLLKDSSRFFSTIQIGVTLAGFLASAFAANNFADRLVILLSKFDLPISTSALHATSLVIVTIILSYFTLVLGELVPKRIAQRYNETIALNVAGIISFFATVTRPAVLLLTASTNGLLRLFGINPDDPEDDVTEEEIRMMVDIGGEKGTIDASERDMIDNIFEFNDTTAEDVMTHRTDVWAIWVDEKPEDIKNFIRDSGLSRFPVYDEDIDDIVGVLNARDYMLNIWDKKPKKLRELIRPAYFVPLSVRADVLFRNMQTSKIHLAIVIDEYGGTNGVVTMEDLLEQIVGNIYDEYDPPEEEFALISDGVYKISGSANLEDVSELFDTALPTDEFDTLSGLIFSEMSSIPDDGSQIEIQSHGLNFKVEKIEDRRVEWAIVSKIAIDDAKEKTEKEPE